MDAANLVHMANRIGQFLAAMPDRQEARDGRGLILPPSSAAAGTR